MAQQSEGDRGRVPGRGSGKERFWRRVLRHWQCSGQTVREFCIENGLAEASFYSWRRTIARRDQQAVDGAGRRANGKHCLAERPAPPAFDAESDELPAFVPVRVAPATAAATPTLELVVGPTRVVRVAPDFDAATLRRLLAVLEEGPSC